MNEASGCACQLGSKASGKMWAFLFFCEDHYWLFVIINQCKKQSPYFEQLYVCVYVCIYIYVASLGMCFFVIKVQYTLVVIWKLWYYSLYGTIFVQIRLYESLFIATTDCVQIDFSNIDCMEVVIVEWLLQYAQVTQFSNLFPGWLRRD